MSTGVRTPSTRKSPHVRSHPAAGQAGCDRARHACQRSAAPHAGEREHRDAEVELQVARNGGQAVGDAAPAGVGGGRRRLAADSRQLGPIGVDEVRVVDDRRRSTTAAIAASRTAAAGDRSAGPPRHQKRNAMTHAPTDPIANVLVCERNAAASAAARPEHGRAVLECARPARPSAPAHPPRATARTHSSGCQPRRRRSRAGSGGTSRPPARLPGGRRGRARPCRRGEAPPAHPPRRRSSAAASYRPRRDARGRRTESRRRRARVRTGTGSSPERST